MSRKIDSELLRARSVTSSSQNRGDGGPIHLHALTLITLIAEKFWVMESMEFDWGNLG
jgi:hypothetical protein